ncbi:MAG: GFA family protein, partial [Alphaproteobacteria bacterium]|nr:GFA family protein [Alphaproteobacteria bacterium]
MSETKGRCHCGAVSFDIYGPMRGVIECYCESCRRVSGGLWHGTAAKLSNIEIHDAAGALTWYRSSDKAQRGFCNRCGSSLFYRRDGGDRLVIAGDRRDGGNYRLMVGDEIYTFFTPLTIYKPRFNGVRLDY